MNKLIAFLIVLLSLGGLGFYLIKTNLIPNVIPPSKDIKQYLPANNSLPSPIHLYSGRGMDVFADLKGGLPRVLTFDENGVLFASLTSNGKVVALPDSDSDLKTDRVVEVLKGLNRPHGIEFNDGYLYVAETDGVSRYRYDPSNLNVGPEEKLFSLPTGGRHFSRTIRIRDNKLYTSVGSSCDSCKEDDQFRASMLVSNLDGSDLKVFASGLRNTVFFDFDASGNIWGTDMGRDNLGDTLPPEEVNVISEGKNYGWPYCYGKGVKDTKFSTSNEINCSGTEFPKYELPAHVAPLGTTFDSQGNLLISLHGSWNSSEKVGYKIVKLNILGGEVTSMEDYLTGFLKDGEVLGRPVDLKFDKNGNLFISDDKSGLVYVVSN